MALRLTTSGGKVDVSVTGCGSSIGQVPPLQLANKGCHLALVVGTDAAFFDSASRARAESVHKLFLLMPR